MTTDDRTSASATRVSDAVPSNPSAEMRGDAGAEPVAIATADPRPLTLWRNRDYQLLMTGRTLAVIGAAMTGLAVMLLAYDLTGDSAAASVVMSFNLIGMVVMSLPAGALVDRWDRKRVMVTASFTQAGLLASVPAAMVLDALTIPHLCVVTGLVGALSTFYEPAEQASLKRIVRPEQLGTAIAVNQARSALGRVVGAPVAGALYGVSRAAPLLGDALANLAAGLCAAAVRSDLRPLRDEAAEAARTRGALWGDVRAGMVFIWREPVLRLTAGMAALLNFGFAIVATAVVLGMRMAGVEAVTIGWFETVIGVAGLVGAVAAPAVLVRVPVGKLLLAVMAVCVLVAGSTIAYPLPWQLMVLFGALMLILPAVNAGFGAYFMAVIPDRMQGRASSALGLGAMGLMPLGNMVAGFLLQHVGRAVAIGTGVGVLVVVLLLALSSATVRAIPRTKDFEVTV